MHAWLREDCRGFEILLVVVIVNVVVIVGKLMDWLGSDTMTITRTTTTTAGVPGPLDLSRH